MMNLPAAALALALVSCGAAGAASPAAADAYDTHVVPLDDLSRDLLVSNGYEVRDDGKVWDKISEAAVSSDAMPELLTRLAGARRLKALLQLNAIFSRYDSDRRLSDDDRGAVRTLVQGAWSVFTANARRDFRVYFSPQELETLDKVPAYAAPGLSDMKDPDISILSTATASVTAAPPAAPAAPALPPHPASTFSAATPPAAAAPRAVPIANVKFLPFTVPSGSTSTAVSLKAPDATTGILKPWTPPPVSTSAVQAAAAASPGAAVAVPVSSITAPAAPAAPSPPKAPVFSAVGADEYAKFVADGPYTTENKALLKLLGERAPDFCLPLLRRTVANSVPQIFLDGRRTGASLRAGIIRDASNPDLPPIIALSPGPVFIELRHGLFSARQALLLPEAPEIWVELGIPPPPLIALSAEPPLAAQQAGPWGATRAYADGSKRGAYTPQEQAGELLEQLLLLGLKREGFTASNEAARRWARVAKLLFWSRLNDDFGDAFLDPDRRAEFEDWLNNPGELDDVVAATWASAREPVLDPRRGPPADERAFDQKSRTSCVRSAIQDALVEAARRRARRVGLLEELLDAGLVEGGTAKSAAQSAWQEEQDARRRVTAHPPACPPADPWRPEALRKSAQLLAEAARAELALRERRAQIGDGHATH